MTVKIVTDEHLTSYEEKVNSFYRKFKSQLLDYQHPLTGLFPLRPDDRNCRISHVRDSVYCATALWALDRCFERMDDTQGRQFELGQSAAKCMRSILVGWMRESSRLEEFKQKQTTRSCLHPRFNLESGLPICDESYKNLQMDCVALFVIQLAQMIASGLQIIFTKDEVAFVQNLVFYLERAYRIPDYGMWERGTKQNRSMTELNASSIGMAKAALESMSGLNLFAKDGGQSSVVLMDIDAHSRNRIIMTNLLPRESASKGTDASLIPTLCWPAYCTHDSKLRNTALERCLRRLKGEHGLKRFSRDGFATVLDQKNEDYQPGELMKFEGIESEWPMFFAYLAIEYCMQGDIDTATIYDQKLQSLLVHPLNDAYPWLPKYFFVAHEDLEAERTNRGSVLRKSSNRLPNEGGFLYGQALYLISQLLVSGCLDPRDLDPLGRCPHFALKATLARTWLGSYSSNPTIQIVLISESERVQQILATYGINTQTPLQAEPIQIWPPEQLVRVGTFMGCSAQLGLSGRPTRPIGQLGTSRFYRISGLTVLCYPLVFEAQDFYLLHDMHVVIDEIKTDFQFLSKWWRLRGRPTCCFLIKEDMVMSSGFGVLLRFLISLKNGTVQGTRVVLGRAQKFLSSGCVENLDFLPASIAPDLFFTRLRDVESSIMYRGIDDLPSEALASLFESHQSNASADHSSSALAGNELMRITNALNRNCFVRTSDSELSAMLTSNEQSAYQLARSSAAVHELMHRHNLEYSVNLGSGKHVCLRDYLLDLSRRAGIQQTWCVVRFCSALLSQLANSLAPSLSAILVGGKQMTISVAQGTEIVVNKPLSPSELHNLLRQHVFPYDPIQFCIQQELILWVSSLFTLDKELFSGIAFIRLGWILEGMKLQLEHESTSPPTSQDLGDEVVVTGGSTSPSTPASPSVLSEIGKRRSFGACKLYNLPPYATKELLLRTLRSSQVMSDAAAHTTPYASSQDTDLDGRAHRLHRLRYHRRGFRSPTIEFDSHSPSTLFQRQLDGCLGRVPPKFYQAVYLILQRSPKGVMICDRLLSQKPTLMDMAPQDLNFIDEIEYLMRPIGEPAFRSLLVEAVMVISIILERNVELSFKEVVEIRAFIQAAMNAFREDRGLLHGTDAKPVEAPKHGRGARRMSWSEPDVVLGQDPAVYIDFASTPANIPQGTTAYMARAAMDSLLHGHINLTSINKDACSAM